MKRDRSGSSLDSMSKDSEEKKKEALQNQFPNSVVEFAKPTKPKKKRFVPDAKEKSRKDRKREIRDEAETLMNMG